MNAELADGVLQTQLFTCHCFDTVIALILTG